MFGVTAAKRRTKPLTIDVQQPAKLPNTARVFGPVRVVTPAIREAHSPWQWDPQLHCYLVPRRKLDDILARLELAGHVVNVQMPGWV